MIFDTEQDVLLYYTKYAKQVGFGVTRRTSRNGDDGNLRYFTLACLREGTSKSASSNIVMPKPMEKMGCTARINAKLTHEGRFTLINVVLEHTHALSPGKARYFKCHKHLSAHVKRML
jgi:hypothetical protein